MVVITGTNFTDVTGVQFVVPPSGGNPATTVAAKLFYVDSPTSIIALTPTLTSAPTSPSDVTVTTSAGASAQSAADQMTFVVPASAGSGNSSSPPSGGNTTVPSNSYVVVPWPAGMSGGGMGMGGNGIGGMVGAGYGSGYATGTDIAGGLLTSFSPPEPPGVPTLHPVESDSGNTLSVTDGGTIVIGGIPDVMTGADGSVTSYFYRDTITFTYSYVTQMVPDSDQPISTDLHNFRQDQVVVEEQYTAADGTGYTLMNASTGTVTYDDTLTYATSSNVYTVDTSGSDTFSEYQHGVSAPLATDRVVDFDSSTSGGTAHMDATVGSGVVDEHCSSSGGGHDWYLHTDAMSSASSSGNGMLTGKDDWRSTDKATFHLNADGTTTATNVASQMSGGSDMYFDRETDNIGSDTAPGDGGTGDTGTIDIQKTTDFGKDQYLLMAAGNASRDVNGTVSDTEEHIDTDSGQEEVIASDQGIVKTTETEPDGTTVTATDRFQDANDDLSHYRDGDTETPGAIVYDTAAKTASPQEDDMLTSHNDDKDTFSTGDESQVVLTTRAPAGAAISVSINDQSFDGGTLKSLDDASDDEMLPTHATREADHYKFNPSASEQDTAFDDEQIIVHTDGLVAAAAGGSASDEVHSTETIILDDTTKTRDQVSDPGKEDDTFDPGLSPPYSNLSTRAESDKFTENLGVKDDLHIEDHVIGDETVINPDGSWTRTHTDDDVTDHLTDQETNQDSDQHATTITGYDRYIIPAEFDTDHITEDDQSTLKNIAGDILKQYTSSWTPVTMLAPLGNAIRIGSIFTTGSVNDKFDDTTTDTGTYDGSGDFAGPPLGSVTLTPPGGTPIVLVPLPSFGTTTDTFGDDAHDKTKTSGFSILTTTDPSTGVTTNIIAGDTGSSSFGDQSSDNLRDTTTQSGGDTFNDKATDNSTATFSDRGPINISVQGSPSAGVTINLNQGFVTNSSADDSMQAEDGSQLRGTDGGDVKFKTVNDESNGGRGSSVETITLNPPGANGTWTNTITGRDTIGTMLDDRDKGQDVFSGANGQSTSDVESDKDTEVGTGQTFENTKSQVASTITTVDPATGMTTTVTTTDESNLDEKEKEQATSTDLHSASLANPDGSDVISDEDSVTADRSGTEHPHVQVVIQGTDSQGEQVYLQETIDFNGTTDDGTTDDVKNSADGTETEADTQTGGTTLVGSITENFTITSTDANTGIRTVTTDTLTSNGAGSEQASESEIDNQSPSGTIADSGSGGDTGSTSVSWSVTEKTTYTNPDGSQAASPATTTDSGSDVTNLQTSLAVAPDGTTTATVTATNSGSDNSSDPVTGNTSWNNNAISLGDVGLTATVNGVTIIPPGPVINPTVPTTLPTTGTGGGIRIIPPGGVVPTGANGGNSVQEQESWFTQTFGSFGFLSGKQKGARTQLIETLARDGFKPASDPSAKKLDGLIQQTEANRDAAAQVMANQDFLNFDDLADGVRYIGNGLGTIFVGKWSGAETNVLGATGSIVLGLTGFDFYKDIADITYDVAHWKWSWSHAGDTALDLIAVLPIVGVVKNVKHLDELVDGVKAANKTINVVGDTGKQVARGEAAVEAAVDAGKGVEKSLPGDWVSLGRRSGDSLDVQSAFSGKTAKYRDGTAYIDEYVLDDVPFDRLQGKVLGEVKGDYSFAARVGKYNPDVKAIGDLEKEAKSQIAVAEKYGLQLEWYVRQADLAFFQSVLKNYLDKIKLVTY
jgi:hypothetical protein